jgi:ADP-heptose:LPS heptosyltransferase
VQHSRITTLLIKFLPARARSVFDKVSPVPAGERTRLTIDAAGLSPVQINTRFHFSTRSDAAYQQLKNAGWDGKSAWVVLNPGGTFSSRNWPIENYAAFAKLWKKKHPVQFLILGLPALRAKAKVLKQHLGHQLIDLTGQTSPDEAFRIVGLARLTLTEDGGLMHMSWVQGVPTLALFGSTRSDWSRPAGSWSRCLNSSDLPCGQCMQEVCTFGDVHCLTRYTPEQVVEEANQLIQSTLHEAACDFMGGWWYRRWQFCTRLSCHCPVGKRHGNASSPHRVLRSPCASGFCAPRL